MLTGETQAWGTLINPAGTQGDSKQFLLQNYSKPPRSNRHRKKGLIMNLDQKSSTLRANPFPKVTDRFCRLPLSTLFYVTRGYSPWRPDAVMSTAQCGVPSPHLEFSWSLDRAPDRAQAHSFSNCLTLSRDNPIPGCPAVKKKRELFPGRSRAFSREFQKKWVLCKLVLPPIGNSRQAEITCGPHQVQEYEPASLSRL